MPRLSLAERERMTDSMLMIQSARATLNQLDEQKLPAKEEIDACLETAGRNLRVALGYERPDS